MEFKEFLNTGSTKEDIYESAQLKLDLITQINNMIDTAKISALKCCAKMLEVPVTEAKKTKISKNKLKELILKGISSEELNSKYNYSDVKDMSSMFFKCTSLTSIPQYK